MFNSPHLLESNEPASGSELNTSDLLEVNKANIYRLARMMAIEDGRYNDVDKIVGNGGPAWRAYLCDANLALRSIQGILSNKRL